MGNDLRAYEQQLLNNLFQQQMACTTLTTSLTWSVTRRSSTSLRARSTKSSSFNLGFGDGRLKPWQIDLEASRFLTFRRRPRPLLSESEKKGMGLLDDFLGMLPAAQQTADSTQMGFLQGAGYLPVPEQADLTSGAVPSSPRKAQSALGSTTGSGPAGGDSESLR